MNNTNQHLAVDTGTNCLTKAEDRIAEALSKSAAWWSMVKATSEAEAAQSIWIDEVNLPEDNLAFTLEQIEERGTAATVLADPEASSTLTYGSAGQVQLALQLLLVIERFIPVSPDSLGKNQPRRLKNFAIDIQLQVCQHLRETYGAMWLQGCVLQTPEPVVEATDEVVLGCRQQLVLVLDVGSGEER